LDTLLVRDAFSTSLEILDLESPALVKFSFVFVLAAEGESFKKSPFLVVTSGLSPLNTGWTLDPDFTIPRGEEVTVPVLRGPYATPFGLTSPLLTKTLFTP
jgi:hypothetical protein